MRKKDKLTFFWSDKEQDFVVGYPFGINTKSDSRLLMYFFTNRSIIQSDTEIVDELKRRGYDPTTIKFEISPQKGDSKFESHMRS